eukprot:TRINITY_DN19570_c0_g1_i1.p1 TRINITY_DN19570_c0_g1~~TRINITY_DN19570_c0_g1_i1.p1  ORF type:complete len:500 (+),score=64.44 TRINITY_DN19570_c0_g1_i1:80-1579(+)
MGGGESRLPRRVSIVFGERYALATRSAGSGAVDVASVAELQHAAQMRSRPAREHRWMVRADGQRRDASGRPLQCVIQSARLGRNTLCAGQPVRVDNARWSAEHRWSLEYADAGAPNARRWQCRLRSLSSGDAGGYLAVDQASGCLVMQRSPPELLWEFYDARRRAKATAPADLAQQPSLRPVLPPPVTEEVLHAKQRVKASAPADPAEQPHVPPTMSRADTEVFAGSLDAAASVHPCTNDGSRKYSAPSALLVSGAVLGEEVEIAGAHASLADVFESLFGAGSPFLMRIANARDAVVTPVEPVVGAAWCGISTVKLSTVLPVLGQRRYEEELRVVRCKDDDADKIAVHISAKCALGFPVGDFLSETLHTFSKRNDSSAVTLSSYALVPPSGHARRALEGMREKRVVYVGIARDVIGSSLSANLQESEPSIDSVLTKGEPNPSTEIVKPFDLSMLISNAGRLGVTLLRQSFLTQPVLEASETSRRFLSRGLNSFRLVYLT